LVKFVAFPEDIFVGVAYVYSNVRFVEFDEAELEYVEFLL
jgi:hypothetical protein